MSVYIPYFDTKTATFRRCTTAPHKPAIHSPLEEQLTLYTGADSLPSKPATELQDIVLVLDISSSMLTQDFVPNRLTFLKSKLKELVVDKPEQLPVGVVAFANQAQTICTLSQDQAYLLSAIDSLQVGLLTDGTAIGNGLATAINLLRNNSTNQGTILLVTDGSNNAGFMHPLVAAAIARRFGITVNTIVIGTEEEAMAPVSKSKNGNFRYAPIKKELETATPEEIARITGGSFQLISNEDEILSQLEDLFSQAATRPRSAEHAIYNIIQKQPDLIIDLWLRSFKLEGLLEHD